MYNDSNTKSLQINEIDLIIGWDAKMPSVCERKIKKMKKTNITEWAENPMEFMITNEVTEGNWRTFRHLRNSMCELKEKKMESCRCEDVGHQFVEVKTKWWLKQMETITNKNRLYESLQLYKWKKKNFKSPKRHKVQSETNIYSQDISRHKKKIFIFDKLNILR